MGARSSIIPATTISGLSGDPRVSNAAKAAIDKYGTSASASRIVSGQIELHGELEKRLAAFLGTEDAIVFVSGYLTNVTVISHLMTKPDAVIIDSGAHNSIMTGAQLSGARQMSFPVGEWDKLDALMDQKRGDFRRGLHGGRRRLLDGWPHPRYAPRRRSQAPQRSVC